MINTNNIDNTDNAFWLALDKLVSESKIIIDRPKGTRHPKYPDCIYPLDYGYLEGTASMDGGGIDVWKGTDGDYVDYINYIDAIICIVDLLKRDSEIKILVGCSENEKQIVLSAHNNGEYMKGILIRRNTTL
jgi:inorganic pyrophosphatase